MIFETKPVLYEGALHTWQVYEHLLHHGVFQVWHVARSDKKVKQTKLSYPHKTLKGARRCAIKKSDALLAYVQEEAAIAQSQQAARSYY